MLDNILQKYKNGFTDFTLLRGTKKDICWVTYDSDKGHAYVGYRDDTSSGVSATVFAGGAYGFAAVPRYDDAAVRAVLKKARENALLLAKARKEPLPPVPETENGVILRELDYRFMTERQLCLFATELGEYAGSRNPGAKVTVTITQDMTEKLLVVSNGYDYHNLENLPTITVTLEKDELKAEKSVYPRGRSLAALAAEPAEVYAFIDGLSGELKEKESKEKDLADPVGGEWDCILSAEFVGLLAHEAVGHTMEADAVLQKGSTGRAYMGKVVASPLVSLTDFHSKLCGGVQGLLDIPVDDEGVKCIDAPIIKDGILCGAMTDRRSAVALGMPMTGNARASEYKDTTIIRMRNTTFHPGTSKLDDMIAAIDKGYYLKSSGGGNGSLRGEFSMAASEIYEIRGGKVGRRVKPTGTSGLAWDALKTVDMVSDGFETGNSCGVCGKDDQSIHTAESGPAFKMRLRIVGK